MHLDIIWPLFKTEIGLIALTLVCIFLDLFLPKERKSNLLANVALIGIAALFATLRFDSRAFGYSFNLTFVQDGVSVFFKALFLLAGFISIFMAREYQHKLTRGHGEFILLILFSLIGMMFLASANDFLLFFVSLEILSISVYIMTAYLRDHESSIEAGMKYIVMGALSTAVFLFGLSFIYGTTGSTSYLKIVEVLQTMPNVPVGFMFGMILVLCALLFKIAAVPFQLWAPDVYQGAPAPVTGFLAIASKTAGFAALVRLMLTAFAPVHEHLILLFAAISAMTILYGNLGAIPQTNIKRMMGYSSIGHAGYLLMGLVAFHSSGKEALLFYLLSYVFSTGCAFLVIVAVSRSIQKNEISEFAGLSKRSPILAASMLIALMSLAGVPPLAGFFAKFYLLWATIQSGYMWLAVVAVLNVITSLFFYLKVIKVMYVDEPADAKPLAVSFDQKTIQYFMMFGIIFLGIFQGSFVKIVFDAFTAAPR